MQLVNADQPYWLIGMTEMTRTFGLELLESVLTQFSSVFYKVSNFLSTDKLICITNYQILECRIQFSPERKSLRFSHKAIFSKYKIQK